MTPATGDAGRLLTLLVAVAMALLAARAGAAVWRDAQGFDLPQAVDALPVYLSSAVVRAGGDPTRRADLVRAFQDLHMQVEPGVFSNLYPASTGVMLETLTHRPWARFVPLWRAVLFGAAVVAGVAAGLAGVGWGPAGWRGASRPVAAAALGAAYVLSFPHLGEGIGVGQMNILIAAGFALTMWATRSRLYGLAAVVATLGAGLKLVPAIALWPLLCGRRWRAVGLAVVTALAIVAWTTVFVPIDTFLHGIAATLASKSVITPDWLGRTPSILPVRILGTLRHGLLGGTTLLLAGGCAALADERARPRVLTLGVALGAAWVGADAAGFLLLYAPLYASAAVLLLTWPLDDDAPRWSWLVAPLALTPWVFAGLSFAVPEARLTLAGECVWLGLAVRLVHATRGDPRVRYVATVTALVLVLSAAWQARPLPPLPPLGPGQPVAPRYE